ncbi:unnamed protein product [Cladocopium goreaui]|uniref:Uncharacterized protein n=1 Tax=Cladocopium goreaui TaxID=2562237 RepID=A0A9P1C6Q4_9DINO|nr:unnamed protein product [Cladocopium goreaui]
MALYFKVGTFDEYHVDEDYVATNLRVLSGRTAWCDMLEEEHRADEAYVATNLRVLSGRTAWCDMLEEEHRADEVSDDFSLFLPWILADYEEDLTVRVIVHL